MTIGFLLYTGSLIILSGSAFIGFCWALRQGQMTNLSKAAQSIFDQEEPVGTPTDQFPGHPHP